MILKIIKKFVSDIIYNLNKNVISSDLKIQNKTYINALQSIYNNIIDVKSNLKYQNNINEYMNTNFNIKLLILLQL